MKSFQKQLNEIGKSLRRFASAAGTDFTLMRRNRNLGLLLSGHFVSLLGSMVTFVAVPVHAYQLTNSTATVGLLGIAEFVPVVAFALFGGLLADAFDRRKLALLSDFGSVFVALALLVNALSSTPQVWVLFVCVGLSGALTAIQRPALDSLIPRLAKGNDLKTATAIHTTMFGIAAIGGPALAGRLIATGGISITYSIDCVTFIASIIALLFMRIPKVVAEPVELGFKAVVDGFRYAVSRQDLIGTYLIDMAAMFFAMPIALFPAMSQKFGGESVLGLLYAGPAIGALLVSITSGWTHRVSRHGAAIAIAAAIVGVGICIFGFANSLWVAMLALIIVGAADTVSGIFRGVVWNQTIPDDLRGRLAGIEMISWSSGPMLGNARAGIWADRFGMRSSILGGGVACIFSVVLLTAKLKQFWSYQSKIESSSSTESVATEEHEKILTSV